MRAVSDSLTLVEWPIYMWVISLVNLSMVILFNIILAEDPESWWRIFLSLSFDLVLLMTLYMSKYDKLHLVNGRDSLSYVIEARFLFLYNMKQQFYVSQITTIKFREEGKSARTFYLDIFLVDGRCFTLFKSGIKEKVVKKQVLIRKFVEDYFALNADNY